MTYDCTKCGESFPRTAEFFYRHANKPDGLNSSCKPCANKRRPPGTTQENPLLDLPSGPPCTDYEVEWKSRAPCRGLPPHMFWPGVGESRLPRAVQVLCAACPVQRQCAELGSVLNRAFGTPTGGVWGGKIRSLCGNGKRLEGSGGVRGTTGPEEVPHVEMSNVRVGV